MKPAKSHLLLSLMILIWIVSNDCVGFRKWSNWEPWTPACTRKCNEKNGIQERYRKCLYCIGNDCEPREYSVCGHGNAFKGTRNCYIANECNGPGEFTGMWSQWEQVGVCTRTDGYCIPEGQVQHQRKCQQTRMDSFDFFACPVNRYAEVRNETCRALCVREAREAGWGDWSDWSCPVTCGAGTGTRSRKCKRPRDENCLGLKKQIKKRCNDIPCTTPLETSLRNATKAHLATSYHNFVAKEKSSIDLDCRTDLDEPYKKKYPNMAQIWSKDGKELKMNKKKMTYKEGVLTLKNIGKDDGGIYGCQIEYVPGSTQIINIYPVTVDTTQYHIITRVGSTMKLPCKGTILGLLYPKTRQKWYHKGTLYKDYKTIQPQMVSIESIGFVQDKHAGVWACTITDQATNRTWVTNRINVKVNPEPTMWEKFIANRALSFSAVGLGIGCVLLCILCFCYRASKSHIDAQKEFDTMKKDLEPEPELDDYDDEEDEDYKDGPIDDYAEDPYGHPYDYDEYHDNDYAADGNYEDDEKVEGNDYAADGYYGDNEKVEGNDDAADSYYGDNEKVEGNDYAADGYYGDNEKVEGNDYAADGYYGDDEHVEDQYAYQNQTYN